MSGHSKWATTKHKKAAIDAKRGKLFARLIKNIEVAARTGGGDPAGNPTLYDAIQKAKKNSVPADNIDRAVKRGSGAEAGGANYETIMYEGYGPNGVAFLVECLTDNRNRAASDVRLGFTRHGGSLADPGSVSYLFSRRGVVEVPATDGVDEESIMMAVLDAGAEEVEDAGSSSSSNPTPRTSSPCAARCRTPALTTIPPKSSSLPPPRSSSISRVPSRSTSSSMSSRTLTTCRTSTRTCR